MLLFAVTISALAEEWQIVADTRNAKDIVSIDDRLWLASEGGLVEYSPSSNRFETFSIMDGLGGVGVSRLELDANGGLWVAFNNRMLQRWVPDRGVTHSVPTISQQEGVQSLNDLTIGGRGLFVATSRGIAVITYSSRYDQWVWFEEYRKLGGFDSDIPVRSILIEGDTIWAATSKGVARGNLNSLPPLDWVNYGQRDGLPGVDVRDIIRADGTIFVSTDQGAARLNGNRWERIHWRTDVYRLMNFNDTLTAITSDGLSWWTGSQWQRYGNLQIGASGAARDPSGNYWISFTVNGRNAGGIAGLVDTTWVSVVPSGPISNNLLTAHFTDGGISYFAGGKATGEFGLCRLAAGEWQNWAFPAFAGTPFHFQHRSIAEDRQGGIWVGTRGGGVARYDPAGAIAIFNADSSTGSRLQGYEGGSNQPLTSALAADGQGNVWIVNRGARDGNILVCVPREFIADPESNLPWHYFHRSYFRSFAEFDLLAIDGRGRKWIASTANNPSIAADQGVYVLDDRGTIADSTDDLIWGPLPGLPSAEVLSLEYDPAGIMWVGSPRGAYYTITPPSDELNRVSLTQVYAMREIPIYAIDIDASGNKWFGTEFGVSLLSPDLYAVVRRITTDPPDRLPAFRVNMVAIDPNSGWAYLGTTQGTAVIRTPYRDYGDEIVEVSFEPNPFNPDRSRLIFTGNALAGGAGARILTPDGRLIRKLSHDQAALGWDGRDDSGRGVADGVYLILTHNGAGQAGQGKVAVIRR